MSEPIDYTRDDDLLDNPNRTLTAREGEALRQATAQELRSALETLKSYREEGNKPGTAQTTLIWFARVVWSLALAAALLFEFLQSQDLHNKLVSNCERNRITQQQQISVDHALAGQILQTKDGAPPVPAQIRFATIFNNAASNIKLANCSIYR